MSGIAERTAEHLGVLVRIPTVSRWGEEPGTTPAFQALRGALARLYPRAHEAMTREVARGALVYRWAGADPQLSKQPAVLMAHQDVVGVTGLAREDATPESEAPRWSVPPFGGALRDGCVWGRGTLDDKCALTAIFEAMERLAAQGFRPRRDVYLSLGADEEAQGTSAAHVARMLGERGIRPWVVLDEGGAVVRGALPGVAAPTAVVGVSEKGTLDLRMSATDAGGHASTPTRRGATFRLARAIVRLGHAPFPARLSEPIVALLERAAPHASGPLGGIYGRARLAAPLIARAFSAAGPETGALVRTTVAVTQLSGSPGANVLATNARARLNVRVAVGETVAGTVARIRRVIRDPSVALDVLGASEPSPVSPASGAQWELVREALRASHPDSLLLPYVQLSASDSRRFTPLSRHVYRFTPFLMTAEQRASIHGVDERIGVEALGRGVAFYEAFVRRL